MRSLVVAALLAVPHLAAADDLRSAMHSPDEDAFAAVFAERVDVQIQVETADCPKLAGSVTRDKLVPCMRALARGRGFLVDTGITSKDPIITTLDSLSFTVTLKAGKIAAIAPVAASGADAKLPTTVGLIFANFRASDDLAAAIAKRGVIINSIHKICIDELGKVTSRRVVAKSGNPAFDKETAAWAANLQSLRTWKPFGKAIAFCDLIRIQGVPDDNGVEGGEVGGVVGGDINGIAGAPPPPPPPPPPAPPRNVPPTLLETLRIRGEKAIAPDDATKVEIARAHKDKVIAAFKLCISDTGDVTTVVLLKSSGFPAYDRKLHDGIAMWAYRPYEVNGRATPVCTAVTFIYAQAAPPAEPVK